MSTTSTLFDLLVKGGPVMIPIIGLSIATFACAFERGVFWYKLVSQEERIVHSILEAARIDLKKAEAIAFQSQKLPIGRFLLAPLQLHQPSPETFRLALETAGDEEFLQMRKGNDILESAVTIAPLLGLLGTVTGLIATFNNLNIGGSAGQNVDLSKAAAGISEALITTAGGMIVAIIALSVLRIFVRWQNSQMDYFSTAGGKLELIYRQVWYEPSFHKNNPTQSSLTSQLLESDSESVAGHS
jgi:biopolymer transport protein ExbB